MILAIVLVALTAPVRAQILVDQRDLHYIGQTIKSTREKLAPPKAAKDGFEALKERLLKAQPVAIGTGAEAWGYEIADPDDKDATISGYVFGRDLGPNHVGDPKEDYYDLTMRRELWHVMIGRMTTKPVKEGVEVTEYTFKLDLDGNIFEVVKETNVAKPETPGGEPVLDPEQVKATTLSIHDAAVKGLWNKIQPKLRLLGPSVSI